MKYIAEDVRRILAQLGKTSLEDICGDTTLLSIDSTHLELINELNLDSVFRCSCVSKIRSIRKFIRTNK